MPAIPLKRSKPATILVHMSREPVNALGEVFMRLPFLRTLRDWAPEAKITIIPGLGGAPFWENLAFPLVADLADEIIRTEVPVPSQRRFDVVFDLEGDPLHSFHLRRLATRDFHTTALRGILNLPHLPLYHGKHVARRYLGLLRQATGSPIPPPWPWPIPEAYRSAAADLLPAGPTYIGISPGAGTQLTGKCWPIDRFASLASQQARLGRIPVIFLSSGEPGWETYFQNVSTARFPLAEQGSRPGGIPADPVLTAALAERLHAAVANCSGTGHKLALGGAPLVTLFGPSNAAKFHPLARKSIHLHPPDGGKDIAGIVPDTVIDAIEKIIDAPL